MKMKYFGKKKKKVLNSINNQAPHHSYLLLKGWRKEKKSNAVARFFNISK